MYVQVATCSKVIHWQSTTVVSPVSHPTASARPSPLSWFGAPLHETSLEWRELSPSGILPRRGFPTGMGQDKTQGTRRGAGTLIRNVFRLL